MLDIFWKVGRLMHPNNHAWISSIPSFRLICLFFGKQKAQKPDPLMTPFFQTTNLSISKNRAEINIFFWILRWHWFRNIHFLFENKTIRKFDLMWPNVDSTLLFRWLVWGQIAKWHQFFNSTRKSDCKSCAAWPKNNYLFWWPFMTFVTWHWPWPLLSMAFIFTGYLH